MRRVHTFAQKGTNEGKVQYGTVLPNGSKMAIMVRNMFNDPEFKKDHYIGLQMEGKLKGSTIQRSPAVHQIICGEKPAGDLAGMWYAENGNIVIGAPEGKVIIFAEDIEILASGDGATTGNVVIESNASTAIKSPDITLEAADTLALEGEKRIKIDSTGRIFLEGMIKAIEGVDAAPLAASTGNLTIAQRFIATKKFIESIVG
tara:strand:+ start:170 stop:778 length:609 start_codon:yes stop_codon:yes gene_type:complete